MKPHTSLVSNFRFLVFPVCSLSSLLVLEACSATGSPAGLGEGQTYRPDGGVTEECSEEGATAKCGVKVGDHNGVLTCYEGVRVCQDGHWTECGQGVVKSYKSPSNPNLDRESISPRLRPEALSSANPCATDPCDPSCQVFEESQDGGTTPSSDGGTTPLFSWPTGNLAGYAPGLIKKGLKEPCMSGYDCQFNYHCVNVATNGTCSHSKCVVGAALSMGCDPCVDLICDDDDTCCGGSSCAHSMCEPGDKLDEDCHAAVATVCAAHAQCCNQAWTEECISYLPAGTCGCPTGTVAQGGHCYYFDDTNRTWDDARTACQGRGTGWELASIASQAENSWIQGQVNDDNSSGTWIGINDKSDETLWIWSDGSPDPGYENWLGGGISGGTTDNCAVIRQSDGTWEDRDCDGTPQESFGAVCEGPENPSTGCPSGSTLANGRCYALTGAATWDNARDACQLLGTDWGLTEVVDATENTAIQAVTTGGDYWVGSTDGAVEGTWVSPGGNTYTNWRVQPDDNAPANNADCGRMYATTGKWSDENCNDSHVRVCEGLQGSLNCPNGFTNVAGTCLRAFTDWSDRTSWASAEANCVSLGGHLAPIGTAARNSAILGLTTGSNDYWVGGRDSATEGTWTWVDSTAWSYTNWHTTQPNNDGGQDCAVINTNGRWNDLDCTGNSQDSEDYVCEGPTGTYTVSSCGSNELLYNGHCYFLSTVGSTWSGARTTCQARSPGVWDLVKIEDEDENRFLRWSTIYSYWWWIGIKSPGTWANGSAVGYSPAGSDLNWNGNDDCGRAYATSDYPYEWDDADCGNWQRYVCERNGATTATASCPTGYTEHANRCYRVVTSSERHAVAKSDCADDATGFGLAVVNDATENAYITSLLSDDSWIDYTDIANEGTWVWSNGSSTYTNWEGQPDGGTSQNCLVFDDSDGTWYDRDCGDSNRYVCEVQVPSSTCAGSAVLWPAASGGNDHCYEFSGANQTAAAAQTSCQNLGYHLVTIDNAAENEYVRANLAGDAWLGANDLGTEGTWAWRSGTAWGGYTNWAREPDGGTGENCAGFDDADAKWEDHDCNLSLPGVCEGPVLTGLPPCDAGEVGYANKCYFYDTSADSYNQSRTDCQARGTGWNVADVGDASENAEILAQMTSAMGANSRAWLGFNDRSSEGNWVWETGSFVAYTNWAAATEPAGTDTDCGHIYDDGKWDQGICSESKDSVCEGPATQTGGTWTQECVNKVSSLCDATCGSGSPPAANGTCTPWSPGQTESWCANSFDLAAGPACGDERIPICNHGQKEAPAGVTVAVFPANSQHYPKCTPDLSDRKDTPGECKVTVPIPAGECVTIQCPGMNQNSTILVNPPDQFQKSGECSCLDNWTLFDKHEPCGMPDCSGAASSARLRKVNMYIQLDKSGSMGWGSPYTRWTGATNALKAFVAAQSSAGLGVALEMFPLRYQNNNQNGCGEDQSGNTLCNDTYCSQPLVDLGTLTVDAEPTDQQEKRLIDAINSQSPGGWTPTYPMAKGAIDWATARQQSIPDEIFIVVLVTDGEPTKCYQGGSSGSTNTAVANLAAAAFNDHGVRTYTIGMTGANVQALNNIADKGGTGAAFIIPDSSGSSTNTALLAALQEIMGDNVSCSFELPNEGLFDPTKPNIVYVNAAGVTVSMAKVDDEGHCTTGLQWYYNNNQTPSVVNICPAACAEVRQDTSAHVEVHMGCPSVAGAGTYSQVYPSDCGPSRAVQWGYFTWDVVTPGSTTMKFSVRTSPDGSAWTPYKVLGAVPTDPAVCTLSSDPVCRKDLYTLLGAPAVHHRYLDFLVETTPDGAQQAKLNSWNISYSCVDFE